MNYTICIDAMGNRFKQKHSKTQHLHSERQACTYHPNPMWRNSENRERQNSGRRESAWACCFFCVFQRFWSFFWRDIKWSKWFWFDVSGHQIQFSTWWLFLLKTIPLQKKIQQIWLLLRRKKERGWHAKREWSATNQSPIYNMKTKARKQPDWKGVFVFHNYRVVKGVPRGGGSLMFPEVPQSSLGILRSPTT